MKGPYTIGVAREDAEFIDRETVSYVCHRIGIKLGDTVDENESCYDAILPDVLAVCIDSGQCFKLSYYVPDFEQAFIITGEAP